MLNFEAKWSRPVDLIDGQHEKLVFTLQSMDALPDLPGIYIFCRIWGKAPGVVTPLYIGKAKSIQQRIRQHFERSVKLMNGIKDPKLGNGRRSIIWCTVSTRSEGRRDKMLGILERGLIEHALSEGHDLLNVQFTKLKAHSVKFSGNRLSEQLAPRRMLIKV